MRLASAANDKAGKGAADKMGKAKGRATAAKAASAKAGKVGKAAAKEEPA